MSKLRILKKWSVDPASVAPLIVVIRKPKRKLDAVIITPPAPAVHATKALASISGHVWATVMPKFLSWSDAKALSCVSKSVHNLVQPIIGAFAAPVFSDVCKHQQELLGNVLLNDKQCAEAYKYWEHLQCDLWITRKDAMAMYTLQRSTFDAFGLRSFRAGTAVPCYAAFPIYIAMLKKYGTFDDFLTKVKTLYQRRLTKENSKKVREDFNKSMRLEKAARHTKLVDKALSKAGFKSMCEIAPHLTASKYYCRSFTAVYNFTLGDDIQLHVIDRFLLELKKITNDLSGRRSLDAMLFLEPSVDDDTLPDFPTYESLFGLN